MESLENEIWVDVIGYEGFYKISNMGRVYGVQRSAQSNSGLRHTDARILKPIPKDGYQCVDLFNNTGRHKRVRIHRLVAIAFIPNPENKKFVNHKWGKRDDNRVTELEWCTRSENNLHAYRILKRLQPIRKLTPEQVRYVRANFVKSNPNWRSSPSNAKELAAMFDVPLWTISNALSTRRYKNEHLYEAI